ncbi:MAG: hypothetical protein WDN47_02155 [Candidatus Doudnabacteria bacterium]
MSGQPKLADGIEHGKVKFFTSTGGRNFGFITRIGKPDLHFHHDLGTAWTCVNGEFCFAGRHCNLPSRFAKQHDDIYFIEGRTKKGPTAAPWALGEDLDRLIKARSRNTVTNTGTEAIRRPREPVTSEDRFETGDDFVDRIDRIEGRRATDRMLSRMLHDDD